MCPSEVIDDNTSAGCRLRCAREGLGLSMRDVAGALNLLVSHVRAIEANRCEVLARDDQFLRCLQDYASLVGLDAKVVVDSFCTQSADISEQIQPQLAESKQRHTGARIGVGALAIICVCLGSWLLSQNKTLPSDASDTAPLRDETTEDKLRNAPRLLTNDRIVLNTPASRENTPVDDEMVVLSNQAQRADDTVSPAVTYTDPVKTKHGKNALHTVGATLPKNITVGLKSEVSAQAPVPTSSSAAQMETAAQLHSTEWFAGLAPDRYTLQLLSLTKEASSREFIQSRHLEDQAAYFAVRNDDQKTWYTITYGLYDSYETAESASKSLPDSLKDLKPRVRNTGRIQQIMLR
ncbi:MAG: helix-turn-helix domain-containing protein [Pseudomonadales bacterium]